MPDSGTRTSQAFPSLTLDIPEPRILRTTTTPCETCSGMGYHDDGTLCDDCQGTGALLIEIVACPVHGAGVGRLPTGTLLGCCDGCATETARALQLLSTNTTRVGGYVLGDGAADARRDHSR